jgi:hypothetical protein
MFRILFKIFFVILVFLVAAKKNYSQQLTAYTLNLNSGGVVYDVALDSVRNQYLVVGNFTSINGQSRNNLAFIDASTFAVLSTNIISSIDGPIKSVAIKGLKIYLGGTFTSINGNLRQGLASFQRNIFTGTITLTAWAPLNTGCEMGNEYVNRLEVYGDTLFVAGRFDYFKTTSDPCALRNGLAAVVASTSADLTFANYPTINSPAEIFDVKKLGSAIYIAGYDFDIIDNNGFATSAFRSALARLDLNGDLVTTFNPSWTTGGFNHRAEEIAVSEYGLYVIVRNHLGGVDINRFNSSTGLLLATNVNGGTNNPVFMDPYTIEYYKNKIYYGRKTLTSGSSSPNFGQRKILNSYPFWTGNLPVAMDNGCVIRLQNKLFVSENNMTTINSSSRTGLAIFCLEPYNATAFNNFDTTICPNQQNVTFSVPQVPYATKFHWYYTGTGADINGTGLNNVILNGAIYNSVSIDFSSMVTPGQLCIVPMSECDERADTLKINIHINPVPNANAGNDTSLTCYYPSIDLIGSSTTSNVSYEWNGAFGFNVPNDTCSVNTTGAYTLTVTDLLNGCSNFDTLLVVYDTAQPNVNLPTGPFQLDCNDTVVIINGSSTTLPVNFIWRDNSTTALTSNPLNATHPGAYTFIVTNLRNGCSDSSSVLVTLYQPQPNIALVGYPGFSPLLPIDTLTCYQPSLELICYSDTIGTNLFFTDASFTTVYNDSITIDSAGIYYIKAINSITGCENTVAFQVNSFLNAPDISLVASAIELNCSVDTIELNAYSSLTDVNITWNSPYFTNVANPVSAIDTGTYVATVIRNDNGCSIQDTFFVMYNPNLTVTASNDTITCIGNTITLFATSPGATETIDYTWSNGALTDSTSINVTGNTMVVVTGATSSGCIGHDTVYISIPPTPLDSILAFKPCNGDSTGQLVVYLTNGIAPYEYSIDNLNFQTTNQFNNLGIGIYTIYVHDSIGCTYAFSATIDENSSSASPFFLNATYNFLGDTIALIDLSSPVPDSTMWTIPSSFDIYSSDNPFLIIANDTGQYDLTLTGFYSGCSASLTKTIFIREVDTMTANPFNQNGIKRLNVYPNPTTGNFTVELEFYKAQDFYIGINDAASYNWYSYTALNALGGTFSVSMNSSATNGTYLLRVVGEFDSRTFNFILSR